MSIFNDSSIDKALLRKERKAVMIFTIFFILLFKIPGVLVDSADFSAISIIEISKIIISFAIVIWCGIGVFISLRRLTKIMYKTPTKFLIAYIILILGGFVLGIFAIGALLVVWFHARKLLVQRN